MTRVVPGRGAPRKYHISGPGPGPGISQKSSVLQCCLSVFVVRGLVVTRLYPFPSPSPRVRCTHTSFFSRRVLHSTVHAYWPTVILRVLRVETRKMRLKFETFDFEPGTFWGFVRMSLQTGALYSPPPRARSPAQAEVRRGGGRLMHWRIVGGRLICMKFMSDAPSASTAPTCRTALSSRDKTTRDILRVGDIWAYCTSALELQNAETKRVA